MWQEVHLDRYDRCTNEISNFNGELFCQHRNMPAGSYQDSCTNAHMMFENSTIVALCRDTAGQYHSAALVDPNGCTGDISNTNGNLTCPR